PRPQRDEAAADILAAALAAAPGPADREDGPGVVRLLVQEIILDELLDGQRARLGGARRQRILDLRRALILDGKEAGRQPEEEDDEQSGDRRVDGEEQPFAVGNGAGG